VVIPVLLVMALLSAVVCVAGRYAARERLVYVFKPLTTILLLSVAVASGALGQGYGRLVAVAIVLCLCGDVLLMLPGDHFLPGLVSFLAAHVVLVVAFAVAGVAFTWWLLTPVAVAAAAVYWVLAPHLGGMKGPVLAYVVVIAVMAWLALERWHLHGGRSSAFAAMGAVLFLASDSTLALNRFRRAFRAADLVVLSTYYASVALIAMSTVHP